MSGSDDKSDDAAERAERAVKYGPVNLTIKL